MGIRIAARAVAVVAVATAALLAIPAWAQELSFDCSGPLVASASQSTLAKVFGGPAVKRAKVPGAEGAEEEGTLLFPDDPVRRAEILWQDDARRQEPASLTVREGAVGWRTPAGIGVGSTLEAVQAANGRPFVLSGFEWDYGGMAGEWSGGKLARPGCRILLRFAPGPEADPKRITKVSGDREFRSDDAAMRAVRPVVSEMVLMWD
ncbi:hypothetical protein [Xanthobacter variabilis]|uniref:hypothetical protein n=1 Tax=Xanthobacter variabilis TaxID=3119932 RepID=UPI00372C7C57